VTTSPARPVSMISSGFTLLIVQPTTLCNLDCAYCYLPDRRQQKLMSPRVAQRLAASIAEQDSDRPVEVVWHAGEPLATPLSHMRALLAPFEDLRRAGRVEHGVQTNATLITTPWIELLTEHGFTVGVSIDGPRGMNRARRDRGDHDTYDKTMAGIERLRAAGVDFNVICVVTASSINRADELIDFFATLGCTQVAFNIEEFEGISTNRRQVSADEAYGFWYRLWQLQEKYPDLRIRDLDRLRRWLRAARSADGEPDRPYDPIPTISATGQTVVLSPELLGHAARGYSGFVIGNVLTRSLPQMLADLHTIDYVREFDVGLRRCADECEFWRFCRGAQAGNRYFEHGRFDITETAYCRNTYQAVARSAADWARGGQP
jgi:uncharacterized protein